MEIRTLIIAILVLGILMLIYMRKSILQLSTTRMFCLFLVLSALNIVVEMVEYGAFVYPDESNLWLQGFS